MIKQLWQSQDGMTTVEYALLLMLVAVVTVTAWATLGSRTSRMISTP